MPTYRDNLEFVFAYAEDLRVYMDDLNDYFANYPLLLQRSGLFAFVNEKFSTVPQKELLHLNINNGLETQSHLVQQCLPPLLETIILTTETLKFLELQRFLINI